MEKRSGSGRRARRAQLEKKFLGDFSNYKQVALGIVGVIVLLLGLGCGVLVSGVGNEDLSDVRSAETSQILDANGKEITGLHAEIDRQPVKLAQIPKELQNAFIAVEDNRFYDHMGIDIRGILRAAWANISDNEIAEGGSTITQQLAKNKFLTQERSFKRKLKEVSYALQLERQYTKQEILEMYLNEIYFGQGAYGVEAAAQTYFGKEVSELDLNECATLAGIPKSPNYYSPANNMNAAQARKATVLDQMAKYRYITKQKAEETKGMAIKLAKKEKSSDSFAAYFVDYVVQQLMDTKDVNGDPFTADRIYSQGLKIYTTLDVDMQRAAETAIEMLPDYYQDDKKIEQPQGALVAIDPETGYIKAMVGGRGTDQFNRAVMAERQPGSSFKPFVFATALENGKTPDTMISNAQFSKGSWSPMNYNRDYGGEVSMAYVATFSLNIPTVRLADDIGMDKVLETVKKLGVTSIEENDENLAASIGGLTRGITPLEMTGAYAAFANNGEYIKPIAVVKVEDRNGKIIYTANPEKTQAIKKKTAQTLTGMLLNVVTMGTGTGAQFGRQAAGKTGTTDDYHDAWFVGYTPNLVAAVWVGCDDNERMGSMTGGTLPTSIWRAFMEKACRELPDKNFEGVTAPGIGGRTYSGGGDSKGDSKDKKSGSKKSTKNEGNSRAETENEQAAETAPARAPGPLTAPTPAPAGGGQKQAN